MKRILTLLIAVGLVAGASAQTSKEEARRVILGGGNKNGGNNPSERSRDVILGDRDNDNNNRRTYPNSYPNSGSRADQINREYDIKINSIRNNPNLSQSEKQRIIRELEADRARKLRQAGNYGNNNRDYKKDKKHKSNNGKHKGWTKGKGNKHRDRD